MKIFAVCVIGIFLSLAIAFAGYSSLGVSAFYSNDTAGYVSLAKTLIEKNTFGDVESPAIFRTPGYPIFLVPFIFAFQNWEWFVVLAQIFISAATTLVLYQTASLFSSPKAALYSAAFFAFSPLIFISNSKILSETVFTFFITLFALFFIKFLKSKNKTSLAISAMFIVFATFIRPTSLYFIYLSILFLLIYGICARLRVSRLMGALVLFSVISVAPVKMWEHRNFVSTGFEGFTSASGMLLYFHNAAALLAKQEGIPYQQKAEQMGYPNMDIYFNNHPEQRNLRAGEVYTRMENEAKSIIKDNFFAYIPIHLRGDFYNSRYARKRRLAYDNVNISKQHRVNEKNCRYRVERGTSGIVEKISACYHSVFVVFVGSNRILLYLCIGLLGVRAQQEIRVG